jgi:hypothetical protein
MGGKTEILFFVNSDSYFTEIRFDNFLLVGVANAELLWGEKIN